MKTIGLIGGMSWQSTIDYYRFINQEVNNRLGGTHSARIVLYSVDFEELMNLFRNDPDGMIAYLVMVCKKTEKSGAEILLLCSNTAHLFADAIIPNINIPLVHIIDATVRKIIEKGITRVGLLGTRITMENDNYRCQLAKYGIETIIPDETDRELIETIIFNELFAGIINIDSKQRFLSIIENLTAKGAGGIILGCTEIPLLIKQEDVLIPVFDTTHIHSMAAVDAALIV